MQQQGDRTVHAMPCMMRQRVQAQAQALGWSSDGVMHW